MTQARKDIRDPRIDLEAGGRLLHRFLGYLIFRASGEAVILHQLPKEQQVAAIHFFERAGGRMFLAHFIKLLQRMIRDGANDDPNDFYDMLQLLLLRDTNLLFVTDDRPFFQYYAGSEHHRVVPWKGFKKM